MVLWQKGEARAASVWQNGSWCSFRIFLVLVSTPLLSTSPDYFGPLFFFLLFLIPPPFFFFVSLSSGGGWSVSTNEKQ